MEHFGKCRCIRHLPSKNQRERSVGKTERDEFIIPAADGTAEIS